MGFRYVIVAGACGLAFAGCGGSSGGNEGDSENGANAGGSESENVQFVDSANRYCPDFAELARLGDQSQDSSDVQAAARATAQYAHKGEQLADTLSQLSPPAGTDAAWSRFVEAIRRTARIEGDIIVAFRSRDTERLQELGPELQQNETEFIAAGRGLGDAGIKPDCLGD